MFTFHIGVHAAQKPGVIQTNRPHGSVQFREPVWKAAKHQTLTQNTHNPNVTLKSQD